MDITTVVKTIILAVLLVLFTACSESDEVFEQASTDGAGAMSDEAMTGTDATDLSDQRAQFKITACGSLPVSTALSSNTVSAPAAMITGQLVSGGIEPESSTNTEHYWSIELEPGEYHLVLDTKGADGSLSDLSIGVTDIRDSGEVGLLEGRRTDYRARFHAYFSVEVAQTLVLRIRGNNSAENYVFGIFKNGTQVPSPFFNDCPVVNLLSLDTTETFVITPGENSADDQQFKLNLTPTDYSINTSASQIDGASCQLQYEFSLVEEFGQSERIRSIGSIDKPGPVATNSVFNFEPSGFGDVWIGVRNNGSCELSVEFTLSEV